MPAVQTEAELFVQQCQPHVLLFSASLTLPPSVIGQTVQPTRPLPNADLPTLDIEPPEVEERNLFFVLGI